MRAAYQQQGKRPGVDFSRVGDARPKESGQTRIREQQPDDLLRRVVILLLAQSMGAVGTSADNALPESFNATLKRETLRGGHAWPDPATCRREVFRWVTRYNTRRRHSWCGQQAPIIYEQQHAATLRLAA